VVATLDARGDTDRDLHWGWSVSWFPLDVDVFTSFQEVAGGSGGWCTAMFQFGT